MAQTQRLVIAGGGRVGKQTADNLVDQGHDVLLIESDEERVEALSDAYIGPVIHGDATRPSILQQADLAEADAIAALTDEPGTNLAICMEAQQYAPSIRTIARAETEADHESMSRRRNDAPASRWGPRGRYPDRRRHPDTRLSDRVLVSNRLCLLLCGASSRRTCAPIGSLLISTADRTNSRD